MLYHMSSETYRLTRTSMALDGWTIHALDELSKRMHTSKAEVIRRAVREMKDRSDREAAAPKPLEALDWLQSGGGLLAEEAAEYRAEMVAERNAKKYWWEL
ncbi:MAG: ribbon-helix-helix protein, CopG family [Verrucomicrobia bacterium]|nr:ribbon-helix-helix protein, CopG family [Verrucomicrobiota bacterium]